MTFTITATPEAGLYPLQTVIAISEVPSITTTTYTYSFGDGTTLTTTTASPLTHTYAEPGTYTITVTATDANSTTETASVTVTAQSPTPAVIALRATPVSGYVPLAVIYTATIITPGNPADHTIDLDFGNDTAHFEDSNTITAQHLYTDAGTYTAKFTVKNNDEQLTAEQTLTITACATTYADPVLITSTSGASVTITNTAVNTDIQPDKAFWDFGDGTTLTATTAENIKKQTHTYAVPGVYTVSYTVSYPTGHAKTATTSAATLTALTVNKAIYNGIIVNGNYTGRKIL
ncbi:PKD domain-containing protein [Methanocorpusculum vombati]|uniref:PKD domain-containing protein n=1 Tax=Methanocorpusculum vombati TaxID=3002864 RepID=A0ABT4IKI3_9EURY|nr:PKD domain-containing protein [Methanocorpusculum vombati]MCZ9319561.1 PKD domain-containing protein [Methanocorpusculum sp.]MCZ0862251.1 PKD domain-containing protein [Methanocorpusculum vombati]MDE2519730.1 PKD domain-containing protein [Methanocorpusculum sp.]MDE2534489.1 PKD domain-containing protein [Methanocorpusculum sp.]MDE2546137.1 PKD domain-containing protein [Methanocorpusculum sp.]